MDERSIRKEFIMATQVIKPGKMAISIETLKDDLKQLTDDFKEVMCSFGEKSKETIKGGSEKVGSALKSWSESARGTASNAYKRIGSRGKDVVEKSRRRIAVKPITYVLTALAAGMLAGAFLKRS